MPIATSTVFVVDDDVSVRESLEMLIRSAGLEPITSASAEEFLSHPRDPAPSCLVLNVTLPDSSGFDLQMRMAADRKDMPIIFITEHSDVRMTVRAMKAGAIEFLTKPFSNELMLHAIHHALARSRTILVHESQARALSDCYAALSCRERQVMALVVRGWLNKQIGGELGISEITVKAHRGKVMRKMQAKSLADLVNMAGRLPVTLMTDSLDPSSSAACPASWGHLDPRMAADTRYWGRDLPGGCPRQCRAVSRSV